MGILLNTLLDEQPEGTFLICDGQEVLLKVGTAWYVYNKFRLPGTDTFISNRTIVMVIANRTWAFS